MGEENKKKGILGNMLAVLKGYVTAPLFWGGGEEGGFRLIEMPKVTLVTVWYYRSKVT